MIAVACGFAADIFESENIYFLIAVLLALVASVIWLIINIAVKIDNRIKIWRIKFGVYFFLNFFF